MNHDDLIARLRNLGTDARMIHNRQNLTVFEAADAIAALVAERDAAVAALDWIECRAMNGQIQIARSIMGKGYEIATIERDGGPVNVRVYLGTLRKCLAAAQEKL